jgi:hypothetical protein
MLPTRLTAEIHMLALHLALSLHQDQVVTQHRIQLLILIIITMEMGEETLATTGHLEMIGTVLPHHLLTHRAQIRINRQHLVVLTDMTHGIGHIDGSSASRREKRASSF